MTEAADPESSPDGVRAHGRRRIVIVGLGLVVTVVIIAAVAGVFSGDDSEITEGRVVFEDDFERPDSQRLEDADGELPWRNETGQWGIRDGAAYIRLGHEAGPRSITVVDLGARNGAIQARAEGISRGWGLVFRYHGPFDYWFLTAAPSFGTYTLQRIYRGDLTQFGGVGDVRVERGVEVRIEFIGTEVRVFVDGDLARSIDIRWEDEGTSVGLIYEGQFESDALWADFRAETFVQDDDGDGAPPGADPDVPGDREAPLTTARPRAPASTDQRPVGSP